MNSREPSHPGNGYRFLDEDERLGLCPETSTFGEDGERWNHDTVRAKLDSLKYPARTKLTREEFASLRATLTF